MFSTVVALLSVSFVFPPLVDAAACTAPGSPTYRIVFESLWSATRHGAVNLYPSNAHWSPLVVASHNEDYVMWRVGTVASTGLKNVAERGATTALQNELKTTRNVLDFAVASSSINANEMNLRFTLEFQVDANHSLVSAITMMAPSPDWFVGIRDVDLCNGNVWRTADYLRENFPYDAGTDSGATFTASNAATTPPVPIFLITNETGDIFAGKTFTNFAQTTVSLISSNGCCGTATYEVTFEATWSAESHPKDFPPFNAHWSGVVGGSHNGKYILWRPGQLASPGVKAVAEFGSQRTVEREMQQAGDNVLQIVKWFGLGAGAGKREGTIQVNTCHRLVSLITMIAPSPDWFVGVRDLNLCDGTSWCDSVSVDLFPYDAGTDSGLKFQSRNSRTVPPEPIHRLTESNPNDPRSSFYGYDPTVPKMGTFTFKRQSLTDTSNCCCAPGSPNYLINFEAAWSQFRHPNAFVSRAYWSKLVGCSHSSEYTMWNPGQMATTGVKNVAEKGSPSTLFKEFSAASDAIKDTIRGNNIKSGVGQVVLRLCVNASYPFLSAITMAGPSPDWFTGIHDVNVCPEGDRWEDGPIEIPAWLYDAGTRDGMSLTSPGNATNPQEPISLVGMSKSFGKFAVLRAGTESARYLKTSRVHPVSK